MTRGMSKHFELACCGVTVNIIAKKNVSMAAAYMIGDS